MMFSPEHAERETSTLFLDGHHTHVEPSNPTNRQVLDLHPFKCRWHFILYNYIHFGNK